MEQAIESEVVGGSGALALVQVQASCGGKRKGVQARMEVGVAQVVELPPWRATSCVRVRKLQKTA